MKNESKRIFLTRLICTFCCIVVTSILASSFCMAEDSTEWVECKIQSMGCSIFVPDFLLVAYNGMTSEQLEAIGRDEQFVKEYLASEDLEFICFTDDYLFELHAAKGPAALDIRLAEKEEVFLKSFLLTFIPNVEKNAGITITDSEVIRTEYNAYIRFEHENAGNKYIVYYTSSDGNEYVFTFICGEKTYNEDIDIVIRYIMNNVEWTFSEDSDSLSNSEIIQYYLGK